VGFKRQLVVGHIALLVVTMMTGAVAVIGVRVASSQVASAAHDLASDTLAVQRLRFHAEHVIATSRGYFLTGDARMLEQFSAAVAQVNQSIKRLDDRRKYAEDVARIDAATHAYVAAAYALAEDRRDRPDPGSFVSQLAPARERFDAAIANLVADEQGAFEFASINGEKFATRTLEIVIVTTALGLLLGSALAWGSIRRLGSRYASEREATDVARRASAAREEFLTIISHDLRNPLTTIMMGSAVLEQLTEDPFVLKHSGTISNAALRMRHMIEELLDAAKLETGKLQLRQECCDVSSLFESTIALFQARAAQDGLELTATVDRETGVFADRERILRVLSNLVGNAMKFVTTGGISVEARRLDTFVRFEVKDSGAGIPADSLPHLFERHWQGQPRDRGLGLGLYICKQIVVTHGGDIGVESELGVGTTFWFTLPIASRRSLQGGG
jgi:signal transduction histidine kinase